MKKIIIFIVPLLCLLFPTSLFAYEISKDTQIYVSGQSIGIEVDTGVTVVGTYGITISGKVYKPWANTNIYEGDFIVGFDDKEITSTKTLLAAIVENGDEETNITLKRNDKLIESSIDPVMKNDKTYSLGLYIKDEIMGIGTLTYIIPSLNYFGSLGHTICNTETYGGKIYDATVDGIIKSTRNQAGEKKASIVGSAIGSVSGNSTTGVYGSVNVNYNTSSCKLMNFKTRDEVKEGPAQILTVVSGNKVEAFDIEITHLEKQNEKDIKGIKYKVTDESLLARTGGIVQGMSGSPIIQDGSIVGAVTHVIVNNPVTGYGIYIEFMFEDMDVYIVE